MGDNLGNDAMSGMTPDSAAEPKPKSSAAELTALRLEKADDYLRESLGKADALEANLGVVQADLMRMATRFNAAMEETLSDKLLARFEKLMPAIETYLRITRQIDRLASLERRLASPHTAPNSPKS